MDDDEPRGVKGAWSRHPMVVAIVGTLVAAGVVGAFTMSGVPDRLRARLNPPRTCDDHHGLTLLAPTELTAHASSELAPQGALSYAAGSAVDGVTSTAWVEGVPGLGPGETLTVVLKEPAKVELVCVLNGYVSGNDLYARNGRVQDYRTVTDAGKNDGTLDVEVATSEKFQKVNVATGTTGSVTIDIVSARAGAASGGKRAAPDTAISEVQVYVG